MADFKVNVGANTTQFVRDIKTIAEKTTVSVKVRADGTELSKLTTTTKKTSDELGNLNTVTTKVSESNGKLNTTTTTVTNSLKNASKATKNLGEDFIDTMGKVAKFGAITAIIGLFTKAIDEAISAVKKFDEELTEFKKVSDLSGESLKDYTDQLSDMGAQFGRTGTQMLEAATLFKKTGATEQEAALLAQTAVLYQNIADEQISAGQASEFLVSQMKAFNITANDSIQIIDAVNEVSNNFAVSSADIATSLPKVASTMAQAGNTMGETIALITAGAELMPNQASRVARGLRSVTLSLQGMNDEGEEVLELLPALEKDFNKIGVTLYDTDGQLKSTFDILKNLSEVYPMLSRDTQNYYSALIGGKTQVDVVNSVIGNFSSALGANEAALNSAGSAMRENEAYMESIGARAQLLRAEFEKLVIGDGGLSSLIKGFLDLATSALKVINSLKDMNALLPLVIALLSTFASKSIATAIVSMGKFAKTITTNVVGSLKTMLSSIDTAITSFSAFGTSVVTTTQLIQSALGVIGFLASAITIISIASGKNAQKIEEQMNASKNLIDAKTEEISSLKSLEDRLKSETLTREELISIIEDSEYSSIAAMKREVSQMEDLNEARQAVLDKIEEERQARSQQILDVGLSAYEDAIRGMTTDLENLVSVYEGSFGDIDKAIKEAFNSTEDIYDAMDAFILLKDVLVEERAELEEGSFSYKERSKNIANVEAVIQDLIKKEEEYTTVIYKYNQAARDTNQTEKIMYKTKQEYKESLEALVEPMDRMYEATLEAAQAIGKLEVSADGLNSQYETLDDALKGFDTSFQTIANTMKTVKDAQDELEESGKLSLETYEALMSLNVNYINILLDEEGALVDTTNAEYTLQAAKIDEMAISKARELVDLATTYYHEKGSLEGLSGQIITTTGDTWQLVYSNLALLESEGADTKAIESRIDALKKLSEQAKASIGTSNKYTAATNKSTSAAKKATDATKELTAALKEQESQYKTVISWIKDQYTKQISLIKEQKDVELDSIDARINALNKLQDESDAYYDAQIDALNNLQDESNDYYYNEIEILKNLKEESQKTNNQKIKDLKELKSETTEYYNEQIKLIKTQKEEEIKSYDVQLDALKTLKSESKEYWDDKINAYKEANNKIEEQMKLEQLQEALAKARTKKVRVFENGQFVYKEDEGAVSVAQQNISEYYRTQEYKKGLQELEDLRDSQLDIYENQIKDLEYLRKTQLELYEQKVKDLEELRDKQSKNYEQQIKDLEKLRDTQIENYEQQISHLEKLRKEKYDSYEIQKKDLQDLKDFNSDNYQKQISDLENYRQQVSDNYNQQIKTFENYKSQFEDMVNAYEEQQARLLFEQLTGMSAENNNWMSRLDNLQNFVNNYNNILAQLASDSISTPTTTSTTGGGSSSGSVTTSDSGGNPKPKPALDPNIQKGSSGGSTVPKTGGGSGGNMLATRASGDSSIHKDGMYLIADPLNPKSKEIVIGSSFNRNGVMTNLKKGDGVVNSKGVDTLAGILNLLGSKNSNASVNSNSSNTNINIQNLELPNIHNGEELVDYLINFDMKQAAYSYGG